MEAVRSTAEKLAKLSESAGTPFTAEEYLNSVAQSSEEMSTEQLRSVAGGGFSLIWKAIFESIGFAANCVVRAARSIKEGGSIDQCLSTPIG